MAASTELQRLTNRHKNVSDHQCFDKANYGNDDIDHDFESHHKELLKNIKSLDKKQKTKRRKGPLRSESNEKVSEFHLKSEGDDGRVELDDLVGSLQTTSYHSKLKKTLESMQKMGKTVDAPLAKPTAEKIQRVVAYQETSKDISKWVPTVQKNRQAEHLSFPLDPYKPTAMSTATLATSFKPQTPLEQEIASVLQKNAPVLERNNKELSQEEEEALKTMSLEEALERRQELQKLRALQSYYEEKCRRMKKIKSKKYHRIKRKAEKRAASKQTFEQLQKENPELAMIELEKAEKLRVAERMSLKHRNTSKWAKNIITKGIKDVQARQALAAQLRISRQLTETKIVQSDSGDEGEDTAKNTTGDVDNIRNFGLVGDTNENPWLFNDGKTTSGKKEDLEEGENNNEERIRKLQPITAQETKEDHENEQSDGEDSERSEDEETFELMDKNEAKRNARKAKKLKREKTAKRKMDDDIVVHGKGKKDKEKKKREKESAKRKMLEENKDEEKTKKKRKKTKMKNCETKKDVDNADKDSEMKEDVSDGGVLLMENDGSELVELGIEQSNIASQEINDSSTVKKDSSSLNPKKVFQIEDFGRSKGGLIDYTNDSGDGNDEIDDQRMTIQEAFANDDVIEEFVKEKQDAIEAGKPKDLDTSLPGWGDWGGPGVDETKRKTKFVVRAKPAPGRKDTKLAHVIINEERDKKFSLNQVGVVPFPYTSRDQWERSIRTPLGKHWNTTSVHHKLVKPRVSTLPGTIIEPIKPTKDIQRARVVDDGAKQGRGRGGRGRGGRRGVKTLQSGIKIHA